MTTHQRPIYQGSPSTDPTLHCSDLQDLFQFYQAKRLEQWKEKFHIMIVKIGKFQGFLAEENYCIFPKRISRHKSTVLTILMATATLHDTFLNVRISFLNVTIEPDERP